ncbi:MAG: hypothetical protein FJZ47_03975 [Candidatus Tectomicrobia bacterium]|uniref:CheW-like domain-containing protein n=1 Tax=Tectimicrobiota bacterium TaxID=2528274 RepID=A0A937VXK6_UNCTE|nr:hypothetical protein [Candidatus Tectomicrobia bacterium]
MEQQANWHPTSLLVQEQDAPRAADALSVLIFRLGTRHVALPTAICKEVAERGPIHTLPHRRHPLLLGLVNIRGTLQPCLSLSQLLGLPRGDDETASPRSAQQFLVVENQGDLWVFLVDAIYSIQDMTITAIQSVPTTPEAGMAPYVGGSFSYEAHDVLYLDLEGVWTTLRKAMQ